MGSKAQCWRQCDANQSLAREIVAGDLTAANILTVLGCEISYHIIDGFEKMPGQQNIFKTVNRQTTFERTWSWVSPVYADGLTPTGTKTSGDNMDAV